MKLPVRIGYHKPFLPTPRCKKYRYERKEEMVELELPEAPESEVIHALNIFQCEYRIRPGYEEKPWDVLRIKIFRRTVDGVTTYYREATGRDIHNGMAYDETLNPFRGLAFHLSKRDRFVLFNKTATRDWLIEQAQEYLNTFLLADGVLYKKTMAPMWRVHTIDSSVSYNGKSSVRMDLVKEPSYKIANDTKVIESEFPWYAKDEALAFAEQEAKRTGAEEVVYSTLERVVPVINGLCQRHSPT